jgi:superfamily II DNA/RNA helicase
MIKSVPKAQLLAAIAQSKHDVASYPDTIHELAAKHTFNDFSFDPILLQNIRAKGFSALTLIQDQVIPAIVENRDVIGMANTGTGKTASFLIPLVQKVVRDRAQRVLVIAPTRELAYQIHTELRDFAQGLSIRSALLIGGANEWKQKNDMQHDPHFVIATPGRLKEFVETRVIRLSGFRNVVLDEADRMVDIGFIKEIKYFISLLPRERLSLFFSATISGNVSEILADFVRNPIHISVKSTAAESHIAQDVIRVLRTSTKVDTLHALLKRQEFSKVLVFGRTKHGVQKLSDELAKRGIKSGAIHGNKRQNQRQYVLQQFANNQIQILLATDVASRGLDIPDVSHVINYDLPETMDDYIHRIGRTGRANKRGIALTFIDE